MGQMTVSWLTLLGLGAFHGINPGMGWLFAVALGMQERRRGAVVGALLPLGLGHGLAVAAAILLALLAGVVVPLHYLRWLVGVTLILFGAGRLFRHWHPRWASMRVGARGLTLWSFLMASAHGAGLMVVPVFLGMATPGTQVACHSAEAVHLSASAALLATATHATGYLAVTAATALFVFQKVGLGLLRKAWVNLDFLWAATLIATGVISVFL